MAAGYLRYRPGLSANLILAGASPRPVFEGPSTNFQALRDELARCRALPQRMDVKAALEMAGRMLAPKSEERPPAARTGRRQRFPAIQLDQGRFLPAAARRQDSTGHSPESTAPGEPLPNLAVLRAEAHAADFPSGKRADRGRRGQLHPHAAQRSSWTCRSAAPRGGSAARARPRDKSPSPTRWSSARSAGSRAVRGWWASTTPWPPTTSGRWSSQLRRQADLYPGHARVGRPAAILQPLPRMRLAPDSRLKEKASAVVLRLDPAAVGRQDPGAGRPDRAGPSRPALRGRTQVVGRAVAPRQTDPVRDRRVDRRDQPEAAVRHCRRPGCKCRCSSCPRPPDRSAATSS